MKVSGTSLYETMKGKRAIDEKLFQDTCLDQFQKLISPAAGYSHNPVLIPECPLQGINKKVHLILSYLILVSTL